MRREEKKKEADEFASIRAVISCEDGSPRSDACTETSLSRWSGRRNKTSMKSTRADEELPPKSCDC